MHMLHTQVGGRYLPTWTSFPHMQVLSVKGPALKDGMQPNDIITYLNHFPTTSLSSFKAHLLLSPLNTAPLASPYPTTSLGPRVFCTPHLAKKIIK